MLGGNKFRLRRGFACGKTPVRRKSAVDQKTGGQDSYNTVNPIGAPGLVCAPDFPRKHRGPALRARGR